MQMNERAHPPSDPAEAERLAADIAADHMKAERASAREAERAMRLQVQHFAATRDPLEGWA